MAGVIEVMARLSGNSSGMVAAFAEGSRASEAFGRTAEATNARVAASHDNLGNSVKKAGMITALALGAAAVVSVDMAAKFEKSTMLLQTAGGMTETEMKKAQQGILDISRSTGVASDDLSNGMYIVSKVTKNAADGLQILKAAAQGATAEGVDMATMTTALTSVMTTYNLSADKAVSTENALVAAAGASKTTMQEFAGALSTVLPISQSAGISFDQVSGAIATMTQHGTSAQEATQELRNGIQNLMAPNQQAILMMNQMGISSVDVAQHLGERGLTGTLAMLREAVLKHVGDNGVLLATMKQSTTAAADMGTMLGHMQGALKTNSQALMDGTMSVGDYTKFLTKLDAAGNSQGHQFETLVKRSQGFNDALKQGGPTAITYQQAMEKMMGGTTGLQTALMLTGDNMPGFVARTKEVGDAMLKTGDDISTNAETQSTLAAQTARAKATFEALMIEIGTKLIPVFANLLDGVMATVQWFEKHTEVAKILGIGLGLAAVALGIYTVAQWAANSALLAFPGTWIVLAIIGLVAGFVLAYDKIGWFKDSVNTSFGLIRGFFIQLAESWKTSTDNIARWTQNTIGMFMDFDRNTKGMFDDLGRHIADAWRWIMARGYDALNWMNTYVYNPIKTAVQQVGQAFQNVSDWIGRAWSTIRKAASDPVRFVVDTVYNNGIAAAWNTINNALGLGMALPRVNVGFATGGIMPGYSPGHDDQVVAVSGGEAIMRPEWTRAVGASNIHAMNAMAAGGNLHGIQNMMGLKGYASGGIIGDILGGIGNFFTNPLGALTSTLITPITNMLGGIGGGQFGQMIKHLPLNLMESLGSKIGGLFNAAHPPAPAGTSGGLGGGNEGGAARWSALVSRALVMTGQSGDLLNTTLRRMNQESGGNPNAINNWDSNAAAGIPSKGLMQVIDPTFRSYAMPGYNSNIYDPLSNILASMRYAISRYGSLSAAYNQAGGYATGGIVPTFDRGGVLGPGLNLVNNATGAPEHLTNTTGGSGMTIVLEIPELGGRLHAKIKSVSEGTVTDAFGKLSRAANSGRGTTQGVYVS